MTVMEPRTPAKAGILLRLPAELQLHVFDRLPYRDAIMLSQVNRYLHNVVEPQKCPTRQKKAFVMRAQQWDVYNIDHRIPIENGRTIVRSLVLGIACFYCFRVKPMQAFAAPQVLIEGEITKYNKYQKTNRCCIECRITRNRYPHGERYRIILQTSILRNYNDEFINFRVQHDVYKRYCQKCRALHSLAGWDDPCDDATRRVSEMVSSSELIAAKRSCKACKSSEEEGDELGNLYCLECVDWVCWRCCYKSHASSFARCGPGGAMHKIHAGSDTEEVPEKLLKARDRRMIAHAGA